jgi:hypothetical protein
MIPRIFLKPDERSVAAFTYALNHWALESGKTFKEVLPPQIRLLAVDFAYVTQPKGRHEGALKEVQGRIEGLVRSLYWPVGELIEWVRKADPTIAGDVVALMARKTAKSYQQAQKLLNESNLGATFMVGKFDGGQHHKRSRFKKSKRRLNSIIMVCPVYRPVEAYIKRKQKLVGFAKGGFAAAARELGGTRGIPGWVTRQKSPGGATVSGDGSDLRVSFWTEVRYIRVAFRRGDESAATGNRVNNITALLKRVQDRKLKRRRK